MADFVTMPIPAARDGVAPDGTDVRLLPDLAGGSLAHFTLAAGRTSAAVAHRTVEEIWLFLGGEGEFWRRQGHREEVVRVAAGVSLTIPLGTHFQFRSTGSEPLTMVAVTMPPWPGPDEAYPVAGRWPADV